MEEKKTWGDVFRDRPFIVSLTMIWQFFIMVMLFSIYPSRMADQAKIVVLQTYIAIVIAVVSFWIGASVNGGKITLGPTKPAGEAGEASKVVVAGG